MAKSQTIARLGVQLALDSAEFKSGASNAAVESQKLRNSIAREMRAAEKEVQTLKYATEDYGKTVTKVAQLEREIEAGRFRNLAKSDQGQEVLNRLRAQAKAYDDIAAKSKVAATGGLTAQQQMQLTYQTTDLVTQIASGQNAMIALLQQGGQLKDAMGGFSGMFKALATVITPVNVAIAALATTVGTLGFAFYKGTQEASRLRDDLILTNNYAGLSQKSFFDLAAVISNKTNLAIGETKNILSALVASGKFTNASLDSVATAIARIADLSGKTADEVAKELIPSFDGSAASAKALNDKMHFLTLEQYKQIQALEKLGEKQEAIKVLADALNGRLGTQQERLGTLERLWRDVGKAASSAWNFMLGLGRDETPEERIQRLSDQLSKMQAQLARANPESVFADKLRANIAGLQQQLLNEQRRLDDQALSEEDARKQTELINDEEKFGKLRLQLNDKYEDLLAKNRFDAARANSLELQKIYIDAEEKIAQAKRELDRANRESPKLAGQNQLIFDEQRRSAEIEKQKRLREFDLKLAQEARKAREDEANEFDQYQQNYLKQVIALADSQALKEAGLVADKELLDLEMRRFTMTDQQFKLEQQVLRVKQQQREAIDQINRMSLSPKEREEAIQRENKYWEERLNIVRQVNQLTNRRTGSTTEGFIESFGKAVSELPNDFEIGQMAFQSMVGSMDSALQNFVKTGKLAFKDFARSIIQDLMFIYLKIATMKLLEAILGNFGFKMPGISPRATGGPVESSNAYLVGEKGPELFIPRSSGTIIPNNQLAASGGGSTSIVYNINAIDTQSFEQRLMGSSNAIWAANMYAQKRLPVAGGRM